MDIASILGFGAIGLGFLLAVLAYRLLANSQQKERPIYIFMVFCLALLGVGAALQYTDSSSKAALAQTTKDLDSVKEQHKGAEKDLAEAKRQIGDLQRKLD